MPAAETTIVFLPRFTTLVGNGDFVTEPLDVSQFASAQFQVWADSFAAAETGTQVILYLEESLDCEHWVLGASAPKPYTLKPNKPKLFSYGFRLRWFRLRVNVRGAAEDNVGAVTCWAEGILR